MAGCAPGRGRALTGDGSLRARALERFGFAPTRSQVNALAEIDADLGATRRMLRLLQGDVGSGKTLVALLTMLRAVEAGAQAALMAPTEVLARQHLRTLSQLTPVPVALLSGAVKGRARAKLLRGLADGSIQMVVGTHALFQEQVAYRDLAVAVIDEQHRFGVDQRLLLGGKGEQTDVLVMTATPIPRTLLLTQWGEMDVSRLTEKPAGGCRSARHCTRWARCRTCWMRSHASWMKARRSIGCVRWWRRARNWTWRRPRNGSPSWRCGSASASGWRMGSRPARCAERRWRIFRLAACGCWWRPRWSRSGVDVPQASVMVIEHAERFGLAQLHQLRGRVGRGAEASYCLLLHEDWVNETARRRLMLLRDTEDGFRIADEDFRLRGGGDLLGTRQAGAPGFRLADPVGHEGLLHMADRDAALLLSRDPSWRASVAGRCACCCGCSSGRWRCGRCWRGRCRCMQITRLSDAFHTQTIGSTIICSNTDILYGRSSNRRYRLKSVGDAALLRVGHAIVRDGDSLSVKRSGKSEGMPRRGGITQR